MGLEVSRLWTTRGVHRSVQYLAARRRLLRYLALAPMLAQPDLDEPCCHANLLTEDRGSIVCTSCGLEICASAVEKGLNGEARSFAEDEGGLADSRVGGTLDPLLPPEQQMGTYIKGAPGSSYSAMARLCHSQNRPSHTQLGLQAVEARCRELRLSADATVLAREILHAVLEPPASPCIVCAAKPHQSKSSLQVALCGHAICAGCEKTGKWFAERKCCTVCSQTMTQRPKRMNVKSTHAAVIYLAAKATPGSSRIVTEITSGLNLTNRQFSDGLRRVKVAACSNSWLQQVLRPPNTELPQLTELLSRRLARLQVEWGARCAAIAALERMGGFVPGHKGSTVVTAVVMLTLQQLGDDEETSLQRTLQVSAGTRQTIREVVQKLRRDERFRFELPTKSPPLSGSSLADELSLGQWLSGSIATVKSEEVAMALPLPSASTSCALPLPQATTTCQTGSDRHQKRKRDDSALRCETMDTTAPLASLVAKSEKKTEDALPEGWESFFDEDSQQYYYHHSKSGISQWSRPAAASPTQPRSAKRVRRTRAPIGEVTDQLIRLFEGGRSYTLSDLVCKLDQPKSYLQQILKGGLGEYNHKNHTWGISATY